MLSAQEELLELLELELVVLGGSGRAPVLPLAGSTLVPGWSCDEELSSTSTSCTASKAAMASSTFSTGVKLPLDEVPKMECTEWAGE